MSTRGIHAEPHLPPTTHPSYTYYEAKDLEYSHKVMTKSHQSIAEALGYLDQVREEEACLEKHGHTIDEVLEALEAGPPAHQD